MNKVGKQHVLTIPYDLACAIYYKINFFFVSGFFEKKKRFERLLGVWR